MTRRFLGPEGLENPPLRFRRTSAFKGLQVRVVLVRDPDFSLARAPVVGCGMDVYNLLRHLGDEPQETFWTVLLNAGHKVTGLFEAHRGTLTVVEVHPAVVFRAAFVANAPAVILVHNHPSGQCEPSLEDWRVTKRCQEAARLLGVALLDHIIIASDGFRSLAADSRWSGIDD